MYIYIYISNKGTAQKLEWANPPWRIIISTIGQLNTAGPSSRKEQQNCQLQNEDYLRDAHSHLEAKGWGDVTVGECWTEQNLAADHTGVCIYIYMCGWITEGVQCNYKLPFSTSGAVTYNLAVGGTASPTDILNPMLHSKQTCMYEEGSRNLPNNKFLADKIVLWRSLLVRYSFCTLSLYI